MNETPVTSYRSISSLSLHHNQIKRLPYPYPEEQVCDIANPLHISGKPLFLFDCGVIKFFGTIQLKSTPNSVTLFKAILFNETTSIDVTLPLTAREMFSLSVQGVIISKIHVRYSYLRKEGLEIMLIISIVIV